MKKNSRYKKYTTQRRLYAVFPRDARSFVRFPTIQSRAVSAAFTTLGVACTALASRAASHVPPPSSPLSRLSLARSSASRSPRNRAAHSSNCVSAGSIIISRRCASSATRNDAYACVHALGDFFSRARRRGDACGSRSSVSPGCESSSEDDDEASSRSSPRVASLAPSHAPHGDEHGRTSLSALTRRVPTRASSSTTLCG